MFLFSAFVVGVVYIFARAFGYQGPGILGFVGFALIFVGVSNLVSYYYSDKMVLALSGAQRIEKKDSPEVYRIVENLSIANGTPIPAIYIIDDSAPNAFATGRDPTHAAVAVTSGLLSKLEKLELEGVIAHELSHVKNYDTRLMAVVSILVGTIALLADFFLRMTFWGVRGRSRDNEGQAGAIFLVIGLILAILSPIIATLIQLAVSRRRELLADASGALLTRYPEGLAKALIKISNDKDPLEVANKATAHLYIANPFKDDHGAVGWFSNLFNTHPPIEERVKALREMEGSV